MIEGPQIPSYQEKYEDATSQVLWILGTPESQSEVRLSGVLADFLALYPDINQTAEWGGLDFDAQTSAIAQLFFQIALIVEEEIADDEIGYSTFATKVTHFFRQSVQFSFIKVVPMSVIHAADQAELLLINHVGEGSYHNNCWNIIKSSKDIIFSAAYLRGFKA